MEELLRVGVIASTHGLKGEAKIFATTDDKERFLDIKEVLLQTKNEQIPLHIQGVKFFKKFVILKFKGIDDINDIEKYKGCELYVNRENATPLSKDEYYYGDLIGMKVYTNEEYFGEIKDILETGANDVYVITTEEQGEILLPAIKECILAVNISENKMDVHIMDGLL
ncbi:16S rRNA processing protein RimM [Aequitasia blattaphilus]|uniref:Ribosome maturation factor RimM n=1 Tax=Aequitasia blattaphilus TaxID=2949332 RepID=A0ABT1EAS1_9FIRM|nr:ribosome maturation factor RimM [Aequitasia blattaphilus]MCP1101602.1 ribosome maturation factor RimM [Aequitasia blattaphilus]MCR8614242.1 ribosome maturation factor RimM [Aequitasia blattaphilus]